MSKVAKENLSAAEIREQRMKILYKILPIVSIITIITLWLIATNSSSGNFPSPADVWERTVRLFTRWH